MQRALNPAKFTDSALEMIAARFRILSEPSRLKLLMALEAGEMSVSKLIEATGTTQTNASRQLGVLMTAGLLARRKDGLKVFYRIDDPGIFELCRHVCESLQKHATTQSQVLAEAPPHAGSSRVQ